jgi:hypothetical protein
MKPQAYRSDTFGGALTRVRRLVLVLALTIRRDAYPRTRADWLGFGGVALFWLVVAIVLDGWLRGL